MTANHAADRIAKANAIDASRLDPIAEAIRILNDLLAGSNRPVLEAYDGPEPDDDDRSARDLDTLADRRAGYHYPEGP